MTLGQYVEIMQGVIDSDPKIGERELYFITPNEYDDGTLTAIPKEHWDVGKNEEIYFYLGPA